MPHGTVVELSSHQHPQRVPRVSVVIPTYNEAKNLPHVFGLLPDDVHEVIVVDGNSVDDTVEVARSLRPDVVVVHQNRRGKGNAMACGFAAVTGDIVVMLDADGSADPREIERFVAALVAGADFAKGSRFAPGGGSADITKVRAWGNRWLNRVANAFFGTRYTDLCYGYNAFWAHCLPALELDVAGPRGEQAGSQKLWGDGFEIETLINTRIAKAGLTIAEVPSYEEARIHGQSNLNTWRDGFRVLRALLVERFNGKGRDVEIVRTAPEQLAQVIELPVVMHGNRVIEPLDVPAGTVLSENVVYDPESYDPESYDPESYDPGPLARALMAMHAAEAR
jgi:glycosyltransferase involved in cell wall biosynthesis